MPELPEVEVVKRSLKNNIVNLTIKKVSILTNKLRYTIDEKKLNKTINKKIISVKRRSKYLLIFLNNGFVILIHLGMTGKFFIVKKNKPKQKTSFYYEIKANDVKHNHIIFTFNKNLKLIYNDVRKFGFLKVMHKDDLSKNAHLSKLGPEPLSKKFNFTYFKKYIFNKKKNIKNLLMDQSFVSGLGNIYVNEVLFLSKTNPKIISYNISTIEIKKIIRYIKEVLVKSIDKGGSSIKNFNNSDGREGEFQQEFNVYAREGQKCLKLDCRGTIKKIFTSNRSTFYCNRCQK
tara:strand:+ start:284 stop:1150 length:867 start_codon:yes stop_codon:yes gene_type:complete